MIEFGVVTAVNYEYGTVNVSIEALDDTLLEDVPIMQRFTQDHKSLSMPRLKSIVVVALKEDGRAVVLGSFYSQINTSPSTTEKLILDLADGTKIEYDVENSKLVAKVNGTAEITSTGDFTIKAPTINLDGEVKATKSITSDIDVKVNSISLLNHTHTGNLGNPTSPPIGG